MNEGLPAVAAALSPEWAAVLSFGPIAFGVVLLLVVWKFIVQPELHASREQNSKQLPILLAISENAKACSEHTRAAAETARQTVTELVRFRERGGA